MLSLTSDDKLLAIKYIIFALLLIKWRMVTFKRENIIIQLDIYVLVEGEQCSNSLPEDPIKSGKD